MTGVVNIYYNTLIAYALFYFFASMTSELPWATCGHPWNTPACRVDAKSRKLSEKSTRLHLLQNKVKYGLLTAGNKGRGEEIVSGGTSSPDF